MEYITGHPGFTAWCCLAAELWIMRCAAARGRTWRATEGMQRLVAMLKKPAILLAGRRLGTL
eukprot:CAMPEP_0206447762 /NCGR_PEP_ID=MMETSP0324_2-20121206/17022_1 /ASSEMBLY_ACC=CAM_ASM_000836 /TAXON_ID=2866 /ORGANISM="Crypthecodinium cohnii, Strain Seligo" /LENGTH=61 /DNA_ID=CAMNT_0053916681 /DNA_START=26 /DNA_END=211 /DNA_ORIENTATION=-